MKIFDCTGKRLLLVAVISALTACGSGGGANEGGDEGTAEFVSGYVEQGPVQGATVIADKLVSGAGNGVYDYGEVTTETGADGKFEFAEGEIGENYGDYVIISYGGTDTITGKRAMPMMAPKGAKNITPLTTIVALAPADEQEELKAQLTELAGTGGSWDDQPSTGKPAGFVKLTKVVENTVAAATAIASAAEADDLDEESDQAQLTILTKVAEKISDTSQGDNAVKKFNEEQTSFAETVAAGAADAIGEIEGVEVEADDFKAVITKVVEKVEDAVDSAVTANGEGSGEIDEADLAGYLFSSEGASEGSEEIDIIGDAKEAAKEDGVDIDVIVQVAKFSLKSAQILDAAGEATTDATEAAKIKMTFSAYNNYKNGETAIDKTYSNATIAFGVKDSTSSREVEFTLTGVGVTIKPAVEGSSALVLNLDSASLSVSATDKDGNEVSTAQPISGPFDIFDSNYSENSLTLDISKLQSELSAKLSGEVATYFGSLSKPGKYEVTISGSGAPVNSVTRNATLEDDSEGTAEGDSEGEAEPSSNWDEMNWDNGKWK